MYNKKSKREDREEIQKLWKWLQNPNGERKHSGIFNKSMTEMQTEHTEARERERGSEVANAADTSQISTKRKCVQT